MNKLKRLICRLVGHPRFYVLEDWAYIQKLICPRCKKQFGINYRVKAFLDWDGDLEQSARDVHTDGRPTKGWNYDN